MSFLLAHLLHTLQEEAFNDTKGEARWQGVAVQGDEPGRSEEDCLDLMLLQ